MKKVYTDLYSQKLWFSADYRQRAANAKDNISCILGFQPVCISSTRES